MDNSKRKEAQNGYHEGEMMTHDSNAAKKKRLHGENPRRRRKDIDRQQAEVTEKITKKWKALPNRLGKEGPRPKTPNYTERDPRRKRKHREAHSSNRLKSRRRLPRDVKRGVGVCQTV
jgi:hypothetical protein